MPSVVSFHHVMIRSDLNVRKGKQFLTVSSEEGIICRKLTNESIGNTVVGQLRSE